MTGMQKLTEVELHRQFKDQRNHCLDFLQKMYIVFFSLNKVSSVKIQRLSVMELVVVWRRNEMIEN